MAGELLLQALFQPPLPELIVTVSVSISSPVDDIPLGSGYCASRTLYLLKCRLPVPLCPVIGPTVSLVERYFHDYYGDCVTNRTLVP
jgi:hypothetical protein